MVDILARAGISDCKPCSTLVDIIPKVSAALGPLFHPILEF